MSTGKHVLIYVHDILRFLRHSTSPKTSPTFFCARPVQSGEDHERFGNAVDLDLLRSSTVDSYISKCSLLYL